MIGYHGDCHSWGWGGCDLVFLTFDLLGTLTSLLAGHAPGYLATPPNSHWPQAQAQGEYKLFLTSYPKSDSSMFSFIVDTLEGNQTCS